MTDTDMGSLSKETGIRNTLKRYLGPDGIIMNLLVLLAIVGIGITDFSPLLSHWYWLAMVVVTGIACIVMEWSRARKKGLSATRIISAFYLGISVAREAFHTIRIFLLVYSIADGHITICRPTGWKGSRK